MRIIPAVLWSAFIAAVLVLPPMLWRGDADVLAELVGTFVAAFVTALMAPELAKL